MGHAGYFVKPAPAWYQWYALRLGIPWAHALDLPHGELMDLVAVDQIKTCGYTPVAQESDDDFWALLEMR